MTIESVIRSAHLRVTPKLVVRSLTGEFIEDITSDMEASKSNVSRDSSNAIHATFRTTLHRKLDWTAVQLAPSIQLTDTVTKESYGWNLGRYLLETPVVSLNRPNEYDVVGYDLLSIYNTPTLYSYSVDAAQNVISGLEEFLTDDDIWSGVETVWGLPPFHQAAVQEQVWLLGQRPTYLKIANDLLTSVGYRKIFTDRNGVLRSGPLALLRLNLPLWKFDATRQDTIVNTQSEVQRDTWQVPNVWLGVSDNPDRTGAVAAGDGRYRIVNQNLGPTSIAVRGRRVNKVLPLNTVTQRALIAAVEYQAERDVAAATQVTVGCSPCPVFWHETTVRAVIPALGLVEDQMSVRGWSLPLDGQDMTVTLEALHVTHDQEGN